MHVRNALVQREKEPVPMPFADVLRGGKPVSSPYALEHRARESAPTACAMVRSGGDTLSLRPMPWFTGEVNLSLRLVLMCLGLANLVPPPCAVVYSGGNLSLRPLLWCTGVGNRSLYPMPWCLLEGNVCHSRVVMCARIRKPIPPPCANELRGGELVPPSCAKVYERERPCPFAMS